MAALFKLDNDKEEFSGFDIQHQSQRSVVESNPTWQFQLKIPKTHKILAHSKSGKEVDAAWNSTLEPVAVNPFVANNGPISTFKGFSVLDFFNLMFKEEYFTKLLRKQITIHHMFSAHTQGFKEKVWLPRLHECWPASKSKQTMLPHFSTRNNYTVTIDQEQQETTSMWVIQLQYPKIYGTLCGRNSCFLTHDPNK